MEITETNDLIHAAETALKNRDIDKLYELIDKAEGETTARKLMLDTMTSACENLIGYEEFNNPTI